MLLKQLLSAFAMIIVTTILLGLGYPLLVTGIAQIFFKEKANGQLIIQNGNLVGSKLIGQPFSSSRYFYSRPSVAGSVGYDASSSSGSNLGPTNKKLIDCVSTSIKKLKKENLNKVVPVDLVTTSASGLDPHISLAAAEFQIPRVVRERSISESELKALIEKYTEGRQFGILGEPRVNVLMLNLALDEAKPMIKK